MYNTSGVMSSEAVKRIDSAHCAAHTFDLPESSFIHGFKQRAISIDAIEPVRITFISHR